MYSNRADNVTGPREMRRIGVVFMILPGVVADYGIDNERAQLHEGQFSHPGSAVTAIKDIRRKRYRSRIEFEGSKNAGG